MIPMFHSIPIRTIISTIHKLNPIHMKISTRHLNYRTRYNRIRYPMKRWIISTFHNYTRSRSCKRIRTLSIHTYKIRHMRTTRILSRSRNLPYSYLKQTTSKITNLTLNRRAIIRVRIRNKRLHKRRNLPTSISSHFRRHILSRHIRYNTTRPGLRCQALIHVRSNNFRIRPRRDI